MPGENSTNQSWLQKLAQLGQLPGESFDKNEAWGKLDMRLQGKKIGKKTGWLWIAAAVILLPVAVILFIKEQKQQKGSALFIWPVNKTISLIVAANTPPISSTVKETASQIPEKKISQKQVDHDLDSPKVQPEAELVQQKDLIQPFIQSLPDTLTQKKQIALVDAKKKMKVVHYNELNELPPQPPLQDKNTGMARGVPGFKKAAIPVGYEPEQPVITQKKSILAIGSLISSKN